MSVEISWFIDGQVILVRYSGTVNQDTIRETVAQRRAFSIGDNGNCVHTIIDYRQIEKFDLGIEQVKHLVGNLPQICQSGFIIGVLDTNSRQFPAVQFVSTVAMHFIGMRYKMCNTLEAGLCFLQTLHGDLELYPFISEQSAGSVAAV